MSTYTSMFCTYEYYNNKHRPPDKTFHSLASDREAFNLISSSTLIMNNAPQQTICRTLQLAYSYR